MTPNTDLRNLKSLPGEPLVALAFGTQTFGSGVLVGSDTQQNYLDHGRHQ